MARLTAVTLVDRGKLHHPGEAGVVVVHGVPGNARARTPDRIALCRGAASQPAAGVRREAGRTLEGDAG